MSKDIMYDRYIYVLELPEPITAALCPVFGGVGGISKPSSMPSSCRYRWIRPILTGPSKLFRVHAPSHSLDTGQTVPHTPPRALLSRTVSDPPRSLPNCSCRMNLSGCVPAGHALAHGASTHSKHLSASMAAPRAVRLPSGFWEAAIRVLRLRALARRQVLASRVSIMIDLYNGIILLVVSGLDRSSILMLNLATQQTASVHAAAAVMVSNKTFQWQGHSLPAVVALQVLAIEKASMSITIPSSIRAYIVLLVIFQTFQNFKGR